MIGAVGLIKTMKAGFHRHPSCSQFGAALKTDGALGRWLIRLSETSFANYMGNSAVRDGKPLPVLDTAESALAETSSRVQKASRMP